MAIVSMLYSSDCDEWCSYLVNILNQSLNLQVELINVDTVDVRSSNVIGNAAQKSQVLILLTTDDFLVYLTNNAAALEVSLAMGPHCFVVVLELFIDSARLSKTLEDKFKSSSSWKRKVLSHIPKRNTEVCGDILELVEESEKAAQNAAEAEAERSKPTLGQSRKSSRDKPSSQVELVPRDVYKMKEQVVILLKRPVTGRITCGFKEENKLTPKKRSDTVYEFTAPVKPPGRYKFYVYEDEAVLGKRWLTYVGPDMAAFSHTPQALMTCLGQPDLESLDSYLADLYEKSLPEGDAAQYLSGLIDRSPGESKTSESDFPSLLHWASRWGLNDLVGVLVEAPGASHSFNIKNRRGCDPADLAEDYGHEDLADYIRDFMSTKMLVDACADVYQYESMENPVFTGREVIDDYTSVDAIAARRGQLSVPMVQVESAPHPNAPTLKRRNTVPDRSPSRPNVPPVPSREDRAPPRPARPPSRPERLAPPQNTTSTPLNREPPLPPRPSPGLPQSPPAVPNRPSSTSSYPASPPSVAPFPRMDPKEFMGMRQSDPLPPSAQGSHGQHELLQLLQSVKDGEFTQAEAERLFHAWQQRYGTGKSKSFKDKQAQLRAMRAHCEKLLDTMDDKSKQKTSLLDKLFGRKKSTKDQESVIKDISGPLPQPSQRTRSTSNIATRGDSGRYSTSSTTSSSSSSSDGSRFSSTVVEDSDSECHSVEDDEEETATVQRRSLKRAPAGHRMSRRDHLMYVVKEDEQPQPPPRPPRRGSNRKPIPAPR